MQAVPGADTDTGRVRLRRMREPGKDTIFAYDLDKAKDLLKQAGYEDRNGDKSSENAKGSPCP